MKRHLGMPLWMSRTFMYPWVAGNIIRYQYRIKGIIIFVVCIFFNLVVLWNNPVNKIVLAGIIHAGSECSSECVECCTPLSGGFLPYCANCPCVGCATCCGVVPIIDTVDPVPLAAHRKDWSYSPPPRYLAEVVQGDSHMTRIWNLSSNKLMQCKILSRLIWYLINFLKA